MITEVYCCVHNCQDRAIFCIGNLQYYCLLAACAPDAYSHHAERHESSTRRLAGGPAARACNRVIVKCGYITKDKRFTIRTIIRRNADTVNILEVFVIRTAHVCETMSHPRVQVPIVYQLNIFNRDEEKEISQ